MDLYKQRPNLIAPAYHQINNAVGLLDKISSQKELKEGGIKVRNRAIAIMRKYHFLPSDAFIGAVAIENDIHAIATQDAYFAKNIIKEKDVKVFLPENLISSNV